MTGSRSDPESRRPRFGANRFFQGSFDESGAILGEVSPDIRLDTEGMRCDDGQALLATLQQGLAGPEHTDFVKRLAGA